MLVDPKIERNAPSPAPLKRVCVIGLGFAGLPTATAIATAGHRTTGLDIDAAKVASINGGHATSGIAAAAIAPLIQNGSLTATADAAAIAQAEVVVISVPTPIDSNSAA